MIIMLTMIYFLMTSTFNTHTHTHTYQRQTQVGAQGGPDPPRSKKFFFLVILYFIFVVRSPFSPISLASLIQIATIQPKTFNIYICVCVCVCVFTMVIIFQQKTILPPTNKKSCVIGEAKTHFFTTTVNWYKYQLTITSC